MRGTRGDKEVCLVPVALTTAGSDQIQLLSKVVERVPKAMKDITSNSGDTDWHRIDFGYIVDQLSRVRIALGSDFLGIGVEERADCRLQIIDMFVGPFNFQSNKSEFFVRCHGML